MVANNKLEPVHDKGWLMGFGNMLRKENRLWWGTRRWWLQALLWLVIMNGLIALMIFVLPAMAPAGEDGGGIPNGVETLLNMGVTIFSLGAILLCQGMIVDEKISGTGEWVLSKPLSRPAFLLAKLIGNGAGILAVLVGLQSLVAYGLIWLKESQPFPAGPYLIGVGLMGLHVFFYISLTMLVGVFANNRSLVLAVPLGLLLSGGLLSGIVGKAAFILPWPVASLLPAWVQGMELPAIGFLPFIMMPVWILVFIALSLWKFERVEF